MSWTSKRPGPRRIVHVTEYVKAKEKAPTYPRLPEYQEPSDEEIAHARQVVHEHVEALKEHFKTP